MMNWLQLLRLIQHFVFLTITLTEPAKLHHLVVLVKTWQYLLVVVEIISSCLHCGIMNIEIMTTTLEHVVESVDTTHRWVCILYYLQSFYH